MSIPVPSSPAPSKYGYLGLVFFCTIVWTAVFTDFTFWTTTSTTGVSKLRPSVRWEPGPNPVPSEQQQLQQQLTNATHPNAPGPIPRTIWQSTAIPDAEPNPASISTWITQNPSHKHTYLSAADATPLINNLFASNASILHFWATLHSPALRTLLLPYLLLLSSGGTVSPPNTTCLVPLSSWPGPASSTPLRAVVGLSYAGPVSRAHPRPVRIHPSTLAASPGHPLLAVAVQRALANLEFAARARRVPFQDLALAPRDADEALGGGMLADALMQVLREQGSAAEWVDLEAVRAPTVFGDVLVLPVGAFGGQLVGDEGDGEADGGDEGRESVDRVTEKDGADREKAAEIVAATVPERDLETPKEREEQKALMGQVRSLAGLETEWIDEKRRRRGKRFHGVEGI